MSLRGWLTEEVPPERLDRVRLLVGAYALFYLVARLRYFADLSKHGASDFAPVGVVRLLASPLPGTVTTAIAALAIALGVAFLAGWKRKVVAPGFFLAVLWVTTYRSSFGKILHSENLLVLHLAVLAAAALLPADEAPGARGRTAGWALRTMSILTVATYAVAGIAKLRFGGGAWLSGAALGEWLSWDALRKIELGSVHSPLAARLASSPGLLRALAIATLFVELGAPVALTSPRAARLWVLAAWLFHASVLVTMAIGFFYPLTFVAFASFFRLERLRAWPLQRQPER